eukprot:TRINITY_DN57643_c0_g1_i1.p1 TRINITY_DN57643_c0_g1~~TRINITY_DN57643_c0_g1_i1.p1  ORF type:complete len:307 (+),score=50.00 TRINITY_DN57643_c0_g1_i1:81-1001(+)
MTGVTVRCLEQKSVPVPMKGLTTRLRFLVEAPSWAEYLPQAMQDDLDGLLPHPVTVKTQEHPASKPILTTWLTGKVWKLSQDAEGCRQVQQSLDLASTEDERCAIAQEFRGHIAKAVRCPYANFVLQKCITTIPPRHFAFMFDELVSKGPRCVSEVARHKYGCRIVQRLLDYGHADQVIMLVDYLLPDSLALSKSPFGNFVMQQLPRCCSPEQRRRLLQSIMQNVSSLVQDEYAFGVVVKIISSTLRSREDSMEPDRMELAKNLLRVPGLLLHLARTRQGHQISKLVLQMLNGEALEEARRQIYNK